MADEKENFEVQTEFVNTQRADSIQKEVDRNFPFLKELWDERPELVHAVSKKAAYLLNKSQWLGVEDSIVLKKAILNYWNHDYGERYNKDPNSKLIIEIEKYRDLKDLANFSLDENSSSLFIENVCHRFSLITRQLQKRYNNRSTINIDDEYDVQDLIHALLRLKFDDIRSEEWVPSYAGKRSRIDFLLKQEQLVIEIKKTKEYLNETQIGEQLLIDRERYKNHPDCKVLICFVYDPEGRITNPKGLENDLNLIEKDFIVKVIIAS